MIKPMQLITHFNQSIDTSLCESTDDEKNSCGSTESYDFDIVSGSTTESESEEQNLCVNGGSSMSMQNTGKDIVDCCNFSNENLYLTKAYKIESDHRTITCNRKLIRLFSYCGYLYGLDKYHRLYILSTYYYSSNYWVFTQVEWASGHINHLSVTLDGKHLWIQTSSKCYLFNKNQKSTMYHCSGKRIYGKNKNHYLEIKDYQCTIYIDGQKIDTIDHVISGVLDYCNNVHVVTLTDPYTQVRILNHKPYYF